MSVKIVTELHQNGMKIGCWSCWCLTNKLLMPFLFLSSCLDISIVAAQAKYKLNLNTNLNFCVRIILWNILIMISWSFDFSPTITLLKTNDEDIHHRTLLIKCCLKVRYLVCIFTLQMSERQHTDANAHTYHIIYEMKSYFLAV